MKLRLTRDGDGHWYVIPADKAEEFEAYVAAVEKFWGDMPEGQESPEQPEWAKDLGGGYSQVTFGAYEMD